MAYSIQTAVSDGTLEVLDLSIKYMDKSHIFVYVDDVLVDGSAYSYVWLTNTRIQLVPAVANGSTLKVIRKTLTDEMWHEFSKGARFSTASMDENFEQLLFLAQEYSEGIYVKDFYTDIDLHLKRILNLGDPINDGDAVNLKTLKEYLPNADLLPSLTQRIAEEELKSAKLNAQGIPTANKLVHTFNTTGLQDGAWVHFVGRDTIGDGGGGPFRYSASSTQTADGGTVFAPIGGGRLFREGWTVLGFNGPVQAAWFGIKGDNSTVNTSAIAAAAAVGTEIVFGSGVFLTGEIDLRGKYITLTGAGQTNTTLKASGALTDLINAFETSDVQVSPFVLRGMTIDGNNTTSNGVRLRWRHHAVLEDLVVRNCVNNIIELDSWLVVHRNVRSTDCTNALWLLGANHNSLFERCSFIGASGYQIKIESNGTVPDGNHGLCFNACDVEFGSGGGIYIDATSVNFNSGYLGENISGPIFTVVNGIVSVNGGTLFFGHTANSYGVAGTGGRVIFKGVSLSNQSLSLGRLVSSDGVKASFLGVDGNTAVGGDTVLLGDALDYGPAAKVFAPRYGKNYTKVEYNNTINETTSGKSRTFTVISTRGSPSILTAKTNLIDRDQWMGDAGLYLVVVYSSNAAFRARLAGGIVGAAPLKILGDLPSTGGVTKTYVKLDGTLDNAAYNILEFYNDTAAVGTFITLHEVFLADNAMLNRLGGSNFANLYKC